MESKSLILSKSTAEVTVQDAFEAGKSAGALDILTALETVLQSGIAPEAFIKEMRSELLGH